MESLLTAKQVAEWLNVSPSWVYDHIERKRPIIPSIQLGGAIRFERSKLTSWLEELKRCYNKK